MTKHNEEYESLRIDVPPSYREIFSHFYFAENNTDTTFRKTFLPSYQTILVLSFGNNVLLHSQNTHIEIAECVILRTIKKAFDYSLPPNSKILVVNFKNDAFYRFFGHALISQNSTIEPDKLLRENCFTLLRKKLNEIERVDMQINYILEFCKPYLKERNCIAEQLSNFEESSLDPIKTIAESNDQTQRNIQIYQKTYFGYSNKEINRYKRFLKAIELIDNTVIKKKKVDWFTIINYCGYYDQSQLIRDFKHYINLSPLKYIKFQQDICNSKN
ncbi:AraC family transcriptional regulator [Flavobacterium sp. Sd200]|uniref:helix-turn-helix transcriptional regulator n=1 Tax=Flavobacterium sp. Sd200 TaxID=2692211 RepID=UPI00136F1D80|nr:helix-turn-helix transcriptional regulator [Flavobacterium sp. Sd200]MXN90534.1 AraC family transcriptional regulator [Flavobacterium sp. Sd200]